MNITFDDQAPVRPSVRERKIEDRKFSLEKLIMRAGLAKTKQQASVMAVAAGIGIISVCSLITISNLREEPIDQKYYYDPTLNYSS